MSEGFETFEELNDERDDHLEGLLMSLEEVERREGVRVMGAGDVVTWRGMMTKVGFPDRRLILEIRPGGVRNGGVKTMTDNG